MGKKVISIKTFKIKTESVLTLLFGVVLCFYLFLPPQIGLADSADFGRITTRIGLSSGVENSADRYFNYFNSEYEITNTPKLPVNVGQVFGLFSVGLSKIYGNDNYSIFNLCFIYFILYIGGFYLFLQNSFKYIPGSRSIKIFFGLLSVLVLSDIMFISYFNSFYQESVFIIAALYAVAFLIDPNVKYKWVLITLLVLSLSKPQNIVFIIFPIVIIIWKFKFLNKFILTGSILVSVFFIFFLVKEQKNTNQPNLYEAVFMGLMREADHEMQNKILANLDLQEKGYLENVNKGYWRQNNSLLDNPKLHHEFYSEVTQVDIVKTYFMNPGLFFKTGLSGVKSLIYNPAQPLHLGNYSKEFSEGKKIVIIQSMWGKYLNILFLPIFLSGLCITFFLYFNGKENQNFHPRLETGVFLLCIWIPILFTAIFVAGGINDFVKHNLPVYFLISILFLVIWLLILNKTANSKNAAEPTRHES